MKVNNIKCLIGQYKNVYLIYFLYFLVDGPLEELLSYFFYSYYGTSEYGVFLSILNLLNIVLPTFIAIVSYSFNVKKINIIFSFFVVLGSALLAVFGDVNLYILILSALLICCGRTVFNNSVGNKINFFVSSDELDKFFSIRDLFLYSGMSIGVMLGGTLVRYIGYSKVFILLSVMYLIHLFFVNRIQFADEEIREGKEKFDLKSLLQILKNKEIIVFSCVYITNGLFASIYDFIGKIGMNLGADISSLLAFSGIMTFVNAIGSMLIANKTDHIHLKKYFLFDLVFDIIPALLFFLTKNLIVFYFAIFLTMIKDILSPITFAYIVSCLDEKNGGVSLGVLGSISSFISVIFPVVIGEIVEEKYRLLFLVSSIMIILSFIIANKFLPESNS